MRTLLFLIFIFFLTKAESQCKIINKTVDEFDGKITVSYGDSGMFPHSAIGDDFNGKVYLTKSDTFYIFSILVQMDFIWSTSTSDYLEFKFGDGTVEKIKFLTHEISNLEKEGNISVIISKEFLLKLSTIDLTMVRFSHSKGSSTAKIKKPKKIIEYATCLLKW